MFTVALLAGFIVNAETYIVEFQFSTNAADLVSVQIDANEQARKEFEDTLEFDGKEIGLGTQLVVSKCIPKGNNKIDLEFSATKRLVSKWQKLADGNQTPFFKLRKLEDNNISVACGEWLDLGNLPNQEQLRIRVTKK